MDPNGLLAWTFRLPRINRVETRASWLVLLLLLFDLVGVAGGWILPFGLGGRWPPWLVPAVPLLLWATYIVHDWMHVAVARRIGGRVHAINLQMLVGGLNDIDLPHRPGALALYALAGIAGNLLLGAAGWALWRFAPTGMTGDVLALIGGYLVYANGRQLAINLIPIYPMDAGLLLRAALWPVIGLRRAVKVTIVAGYGACAFFILSAVVFQSLLWLILGIMLLMSMVREHQAIRSGYDPWLRTDPAYAGGGRSGRPGLFARWREARRRRAEERREREEEAEQVVLDRLLAKVSEHGLPALTRDERTTLERISRRQRERQGT